MNTALGQSISAFEEQFFGDSRRPRISVGIGFNWNSPFFLSPHNPSVVYFGGNRVLKSNKRGEELQIGDMLQALEDVELDDAIVAKGSKVSVSGLKSAGGRVLLDVALADGHVVRAVPLGRIRTHFQRVDG